jgi:solute carrier family 35, member F1/2
MAKATIVATDAIVLDDDPSSSCSSTNDDTISNTTSPPTIHHHPQNSTADSSISKWKIVLAGQLLSFLLACSGATQATLQLDCELTAPSFAVGLYYASLVVCAWIPFWWSQQQQESDRSRNFATTSLQTTTTTVVSPITTRRYHKNNDHHLGEYQGTSMNMTMGENSQSGNGVVVVLANDDSSFEEDNPNPPDSSTSAIYSFFHLRLHSPWYTYAGMAVLDVYANCVTVLAFRYTTISSVTLLDAMSIPAAMLLSCVILRRRYYWTHLLGVVLCLTGITVNVLPDLRNKNVGGDDDIDAIYPHKLRGDLLSVLGGVLFGANNVLGEVVVQNSRDPNEFIGMMSLFAAMICAVQTSLLERHDVATFVFGLGGDNKSETCSLGTARWLLLAFVLTNVVSYMGGARFLLHSEAAFFNLCLLTGDFWSVAFQVLAEHIHPRVSFYVAVVLTATGVLLYELAAPTPQKEIPVIQENRSSRGESFVTIELVPTTTTQRWSKVEVAEPRLVV